jgi:MYXO-CTERM domain-containing protein
VNPADLGIEIGNSAYAAVVEVDQAGNVSVASDLVCISRVATSGFCDAAGENCQSCSVSGAGIPGKSAAPLLAIMGLALLALSRRKSRP